MRLVWLLVVLAVFIAGCVQETTTTTSTASTTMPTTTTISYTTTSTASTTTTTETSTITTLGTTTTLASVEKGIEIISAKSGSITVKNIGKVYYILASDVTLYINGQEIEPKWSFTVIYPTSSMTSRAICNAGDTIRAVAPGNEDSGICTV
jgi:PBP1b-binding outer membrane lipoprotein LpoB